MSETSITCPNCNASNPPRSIQCAACGHDLKGGDSQTRYITSLRDLIGDGQHDEGKVFFARSAQLALYVVSATNPATETKIICDFSQSTFTIGRNRETDKIDSPPHIDLSAYDAADKGVSRVHARITRIHATVVIEDLGALNGTSVNGERVSPVAPRVLADGDLIHLGSFPLRVSFESGA